MVSNAQARFGEEIKEKWNLDIKVVDGTVRTGFRLSGDVFLATLFTSDYEELENGRSGWDLHSHLDEYGD